MPGGALIKQHIQRYVNSVPNVVLLLGIKNGKSKKPIFKIKNVKALHDFRFDSDDILARIVSGIGDGIYLGLGDGALNDYEISSVFEYDIFNMHQLENLKPIRSTVLSIKNPGEVQVTEQYDYEKKMMLTLWLNQTMEQCSHAQNLIVRHNT